MKKTYMINTRKSDGSMVQKGVLAEDSSATPPVLAIIVAIQAALSNAGAGAEVLNISFGATVDIDTTVA
jgi:hypothetical protein